MLVSRFHIFLFASALFAFSCTHKKETLKAVNKDIATKTTDPLEEKLGLSKKEIKHSKLYSFIDEWYGVPYKYGGCQKTGVDCSCFTDLLYENVYGTKTARSAGEIYKECDKISLDKIKEGDLVFFITNGKNISHVGVYLKNDKFAHASTSRGVMISDLKEPYYKKTFYSAGKLKHSLSWKD
ncbi:MAG: C40 family peptidase [Bacteroidia bacterium]